MGNGSVECLPNETYEREGKQLPVGRKGKKTVTFNDGSVIGRTFCFSVLLCSLPFSLFLSDQCEVRRSQI